MFKNQIFNNFHLIKDFIVEYRDAWKRIEISPKASFIILDHAGHVGGTATRGAAGSTQRVDLVSVFLHGPQVAVFNDDATRGYGVYCGTHESEQVHGLAGGL